MDSLLFSIGAILPLLLMVSVGYFLKRIGLINQSLARSLNKLVFRVFLPVMLFLNVYRIESFASIGLGYLRYAVLAVLVTFALAIPVVLLVTPTSARRGVMLQGIFRSNYALIGIPLAEALFGQEGVIVASVLSAIAIPLFNVLAVVSLSIFQDEKEKKEPPYKKILLGIAKNPLIQGILLGGVVLCVRALFVKKGIAFRLSDLGPVWDVLESLSSVSTPLALLVLGAQFEFSAIPTLKKEIITVVFARGVVLPLLGLGIPYFFFPSFTGAHYAALVALLATPVGVSTVPMAQEMGGDSTLAGQLVVFTTLFSMISVFVAAFILRSVGIF